MRKASWHWAVIAASVLMVGCGESGPTGPVGPQGPPGPMGPSKVLSRMVGCSGKVTHPDTGVSFLLFHDAYVFSDRSILVACEVAGPGASIHSTDMFASDMQGTLDAGCSLVADLDNGSGGWWDFAMNRGYTESTATYIDPGQPAMNRSVRLSCQDY
jgi:hypothetical protein